VGIIRDSREHNTVEVERTICHECKMRRLTMQILTVSMDWSLVQMKGSLREFARGVGVKVNSV
jgi:hypothetical protein